MEKKGLVSEYQRIQKVYMTLQQGGIHPHAAPIFLEQLMSLYERLGHALNNGHRWDSDCLAMSRGVERIVGMQDAYELPVPAHVAERFLFGCGENYETGR